MSYDWVKKEHPEQAPAWCSVDFSEDARITHLHQEGRKKLFGMLVSLGVREIELGAPANTEEDFSFLQVLKAEELIPEGVRIQVRTQPDERSVQKTLEAVQGLGSVTIHLCAPALARGGVGQAHVFHETEIVKAAALLERMSDEQSRREPDTFPRDIAFECSIPLKGYAEIPEAVRFVDGVCAQWRKRKSRRVIMSFEEGSAGLMPHVFTSCLEEIHGKIRNPEEIIFSVRTVQTQAAMSALLAGAARVEGSFFGEGTRGARADIFQLAAGLTACSISHGLRLDKCTAVLSAYENLTHTKITGPGHGDAAYILDLHYGIVLPGGLREEFESYVGACKDRQNAAQTSADILQLFEEQYLFPQGSFLCREVGFQDSESGIRASVLLETDGDKHLLEAEGNGILDAVSNCFRQHFGLDYRLETYEEHALGEGSEARALSFVGIVCDEKHFYGAGIHEDISKSSVAALSAAVGRLCAARNENNAENERIHRILNYIREHYKNVTLDELSSVFYLSKPYLSKYIREKSGLTFGENLKKIRLQKAASLLKNSNMKIEQVANAAGYPNVEHFNRQFKKKFGCTPVQYRTT